MLLAAAGICAIATSAGVATANASGQQASVQDVAAAGGQVGQPWRGAPAIEVPFSEILADSRRSGRAGKALPVPQPAPGGRPTPEAATHGGARQAAARPAGGPQASAPVAATSFLGAQISETSPMVIPPDSMGSVGPSQIVVAVNGRLKVFDKGGNVGFSVTDDAFWASVRNGDAVTDPGVEYDRLSGRWIISAVNEAAANNRVMIAVSSGPTITGQSSFSFFQFQQAAPPPAGNPALFADYPQLGVDANAVYIGVNDFPTLGPQASTTGFVVRKSDLLNGTLTVTAFRGLATGSGPGPFSPQGVTNADPSATEGYFIGVDNQVFGQLTLRRVSNPGGTPSISGNLAVSVPNTAFPLSVPAQGTSTSLDAVDDRLMEAMIARAPGGEPQLWTSHSIAVNSAGNGTPGGDRDGLRWYELGGLSGTPTVAQSGTVFDSAASSPAFYFMPSIAASGQGHALLASSVAGSGRFAGIAAAQRFAGDPAGTMSAPAVIQPSTSPYDVTVTNPQRWGDYSQTVVDPTDNMTFWTFQEYANATNSWGVRVTQVKAPPPATPASVNLAAVPASASVAVTLTGTSADGSGFFDPGPDTGGPGFPNHIAASVSGGVGVNNVAFTDPTHLTLDLNTAGASNGPKDVTITNPDGQSATGSSVLLVDTTAPRTKIGHAPKRRTHSRRAAFRFSSNEPGSTFQCKLDRRPWRGCKSPRRYKRLKLGRHTFRVKATDPAGNVDGTPARRRFTILP